MIQSFPKAPSRALSAVFLVAWLWVCTASVRMIAAVPGDATQDKPSGTEILWDTWGVPHLFANDLDGIGYAFGWAQMEAHANLILHLYGEDRGRSAEYWGGDENLERDRLIQTFGVPELAERWVQQQSPEFDGFLRAFVSGLNAYAAEHADAIAASERVVLPVTAQDVLAHLIRAIHLTFVAHLDAIPTQLRQWEGTAGSNAWAVAPKRTADGHALLLANPHLPWNGLYVFFESHWNAPGLDGYGATLVGMPMMAIAFNERLGWTHTVNTHDGCDLYDLSLADQGYRWDGQIKPFETTSKTLRVRQTDGSMKDEKLIVRRSIHGPVLGEKTEHALAVRVVGLDSPQLGQEYLDLIRAGDLQQFEAALRRLQMPMFTVMYADAQGHIMHLFGGQTPIRPPGAYKWSGVVPGDTSATLWTETLPYEKLPRIVDPESGWLQNANDPPWTTTFPRAVDPEQFPAYIAPRGMGLRPQRSAKLLMANDHFTFEQLIAAKHDTHVELADRILDDVLAAADKQPSGKAHDAAVVLHAWDRRVDVGSRGADLFENFVRELMKRNKGSIPFQTRWDPTHPLETPKGLANPTAAVAALETAVDTMQNQHQALDVAWGETHQVGHGAARFPANGTTDMLGVFRAAWYNPARDGGPVRVAGGDSYVCVTEFSRPVRARAALGYGNASQPGAKHASDQFELFSQKRLRDVWLTRPDIEAHLERKEHL